MPNFSFHYNFACFIQLFARITKLGWFDADKEDYVFRNVTGDVSKFLQVMLKNVRLIQLKTLFCHNSELNL